jgi:hypothetical protein
VSEQRSGEWIDGKGRTVNEMRRLGQVEVGVVLLVDGLQYLVGDINEMYGTCDDCRMFSGTEVVEKYRLIEWEDKNL